MKILIAGASGLVGRATAAVLRDDGHEVLRLVRPAASSPDEVTWDPAAGELPVEACRSAEAIINLCGASLAAGRWTQRRRGEIRASRIDPTRAIAKAFGWAGSGQSDPGSQSSFLAAQASGGGAGRRGGAGRSGPAASTRRAPSPRRLAGRFPTAPGRACS